MGYLQHGRRHLPGGTDPVDLLPLWTPFAPAVDDGELDDGLSYGFAMIQGAVDFETVAVQMRVVAFSEPGSKITTLPGVGSVTSMPILIGMAFSSVTDPWDTPFHAYVCGDGTIIWPFGGPAGVGPSGDLPGDILFVGGGVYPYGVTWPNP